MDPPSPPEVKPIQRVNAMTEAELLELLRCDEVLEPEDGSSKSDDSETTP
jgi:hypothetical protein